MKANRQSPALLRWRRPNAALFMLLLALLLALTGGVALRAQEGADPTPTPEATEPLPSETPPATELAPTETETPPATESSPTEMLPAAPLESPPQPVPQTSCRLEISDAGDSNPFTYRFEAISSPDITNWSWDAGDGATYSGTAVVNHTYAAPGSYTITLTCTPASGAPLTLTGTVFVTTNPIAAFDVLPNTVNVGNPPFSVSTLNRSSGTGLSYEWRVSTSSNPLDPPIQTWTTENITYPLPSYGSFWFHLFVTDLGGTTVIASRQVTLQAPAPLARFNMTPTDGLSPLTVTFTGVDLGGGPITTWEWDMGDGTTYTFASPAPFDHTFTIDPLAYPNGRTFTVRLRYTGPGGFGEFAREVGVYPPTEPVDAQFSWQSQGNAPGGLVTICFTNLSTGPWVISEWDWEDDGVYDLRTTDSIVCRDFPEGPRTVRLWVADNTTATPSAPTGATSNAAQNLSIVAAPVASFNAVPGTTITWGDLISFVDTSTGTITTWSWDFNGDGVEDSNQRNPSNIALGQTIGGLGGNTVRLTVTGPGGSSFAEMLIVVARREITCAISGLTEVIPTASNQTYTATVNQLLGRQVTYTWRVTGTDSVPPNDLPLVVTGGPAASVPNLPLNFANFGVGTFVITLEAQTADGAACSATRTVTYNWRPLDCRMLVSPAFPSPHYPSTTTYNFSIDNANLNRDGRAVNSIVWRVNGTPLLTTTDPLQTFPRQWLSPTTETIRYDIVVDNGDGTTATCYEEQTVTVQNWPPLTCAAPTGVGNPQPVTPDNPTRSYNYTAPVSGAAGRTVTYTWTVSGGTITSANPRVGNNNATVQWDAAAGAFPPAPQDDSIGYTARVTNPDGTTDECSASLNIGVTVNRLQCNAPTGDLFPVVGETELYSPTLVNHYGRPISLTWEFQVFNTATSAWENVVPPPAFDLNANPFSYQFLTPDRQYRLRYSASAAAAAGLPADSCGPSPYLTPIQVGGADISFDCDAFPGAPTNNLNPTSATASYPYTIDMDNGNNLLLTYTWVLVGPGATERTLGTFDNVTANGLIRFPPLPSPGFSGAAFGPVDNYTLRVDVRATDLAATSYTCSMQRPLTVGTLNVDYTFVYSDGSAVNPNAVEVGRQICFTNTSSTSHGGIDAMTYTWAYGTTNNSLGVAGQAGQNPSPNCFSFTQPSGPGGYTVTLTGEALDLNGNPNGRTGQRSVTFTVYGSQSISINRSNQQFAPTTMTFEAIGVNITGGYSWLFERWDGAAWVNFPDNTKAGQTVNQFFPSAGRYRATVTGSGPLGPTTAQTQFELLALTDIRAAFTPAPYGGLAPLNVCFTDRSASSSPIVSWEWDFNSDGTVDSTTQNPCTTYTAGSTVYTITLRIRNQNGQTATATNVVRTYRDWEAGASFSIAPQGSGRYCFTASITGLQLVGWDFGDGTTGGPESPICTTYAASGTYVVTMTVRNPSTGETGDIQRGLEVNLGGGTPPNLSASGTCSADRTATFRVTNGGGAMTTPDIVTIRNAAGAVIRTESLLLGAGAFRDIILTDMEGPVTLTTLDSGLNFSTTCFYRPVISVSAACGANSLPVFTVSNARPTDGPMFAPQNFTITNSAGATLLMGSFWLELNETSETFAVPAGSDPYDTYTFNSSGAVGSLTMSQNCAQRPSIALSSQCVNGDPAFTVRNTSANPMVVAQAFTITSSTAGDVTPAPGTFQLAAGASTTITLSGLDPYAIYTFNTSGFAGMATNVRSCGLPNLTVTSACISPIAFTIRNTGGANMLQPQSYTITNSAGTTVRTGSFQLPADGTTTIALDGLDPYAGYTITSSGFAGTLNMTQTCARPALTAESSCADPLTFTVRNAGGAMLAAQPYTVTDASGRALASGTLQIPAGGSQTITLTGISPYGGRTLTTSGFAGALNQTQTCAAPRLTVQGVCYPAVFTVTNTGGSMLASQPFTLTQGGGSDITPAPGVLQLASGESLAIPVPSSADMNAGVTFSTARYEATATLNLLCPSDSVAAASAALAASGSADSAGQAVAAGGPRPDGLGAGVFTLPDALRGAPAGGPVCGVSCPVWRVYHSDDTGDWEIFRLDRPVNDQTQRINLSHGPNADDMSPSRSPDSRWIVFTSNRDSVEGQPENWEIYIASTDGDPASVQRVTYNTIALDTNPAWGPNNAIVYQTTRHGSWDLYLIDMETGIEYRLTESEWDEINPAWSPDGSRIAFQSNRDGHWHIHVLDLAGRSVAQLTGDNGGTPAHDVDPQFAPDGRRIAFRRYEQLGGPSRLMMMDADGRNQRAITAPDMDATNQAWSPSGRLIAFQAVRGGQLDVYVYDTASDQTRQLTDSVIRDYAPTWLCGDEIVVFTSDVSGSPDIYEAPALPIDAPAVDVETEAERLTFEPADDIYPQNLPPKEFASREGQTSAGVFGLQTAFLLPAASVTPPDPSRDDIRAREWRPINTCPAPGL